MADQASQHVSAEPLSVISDGKNDSSNLIDDEQFEAMKMTFLAKGKGRRPSLPSIVIDNKFLLQLFALKEESGCTWEKVDSWFAQACPGSLRAQSQRKLIERTVKCYESLSKKDQASFVLVTLDVNEISPSLTSLGISKINATSPPLKEIFDSYFEHKIVNNQCVVDFFQFHIASKIPLTNLYSWMMLFFPEFEKKEIEKQIAYTVKTFKDLQKNKHRNPDPFFEFLQHQFVIISRNIFPCRPTPCLTKTPDKKCSNCISLKEEKKDMFDVLSSIQTENANIKSMLKEKQDKLAALEQILETKKHEKRTRAKKNWKVEYKKLKSEYVKLNSKNVKLIKENDNLKKEVIECKKKMLMYKKKMKSCEKENISLHADKDIVCPVSIPVVKESKNKNAYANNIRKTAIELQSVAGVSAENVSNAIDSVSRHVFNYSFCKDKKKLPCGQTALNMLDEGLVLSNMQAAEAILNCENVTIHSDGTSRDQKKVVGHQLCVDGDKFFLGFKPVASEDAETLLDLTVDVLRQLSFCYEDISDFSSHDLHRKILSKISNTMSDRAAVMKLYGKKLEEFLKLELSEDKSINFLHCNAHFLLGLSSACEKALAATEITFPALGRDKCSKFSTFKSDESATSRIIRTACDILGPRGDQKNGCRMDWVIFCNESTIPSFKSNRFNCFFEAAASLIHHLCKIRMFFSSGILSESVNLKIQSVSLDIDDDVLMSFVCALALFYLKITGPYWILINSSNVCYSEFHEYVDKMFACFDQWSHDPTPIFDDSFMSIFGESFCIKTVSWQSVHQFASGSCHDIIFTVVKALCHYSLDVLKRQLSDFLPGGSFASVNDLVSSQIRNCSLTNLLGESAFGDLDFDLSKRRNASLHNRTAIHIVKRNKAIKYLNKKSKIQQQKMFCSARKKASLLRKKNREFEGRVKDKIREKFLANQQRKIDKSLSEISRNASIVENVKDYGGPCECFDDVDSLLNKFKRDGKSKTKIIDCFKREIRYQKLINKKKLKFGDLDFMVQSLKDSFPISSFLP